MGRIRSRRFYRAAAVGTIVSLIAAGLALAAKPISNHVYLSGDPTSPKLVTLSVNFVPKDMQVSARCGKSKPKGFLYVSPVRIKQDGSFDYSGPATGPRIKPPYGDKGHFEIHGKFVTSHVAKGTVKPGTCNERDFKAVDQGRG